MEPLQRSRGFSPALRTELKQIHACRNHLQATGLGEAQRDRGAIEDYGLRLRVTGEVGKLTQLETNGQCMTFSPLLSLA